MNWKLNSVEINMNNMNVIKIILAMIFGLVCTDILYAQTDEEGVMATMEKVKQAIAEQDIDKIVENYSDNFVSDEANGIDELRIFWQAVKEAGYMEKIEINLETAKLEISDGVALISLLDDEGEVDMRFELQKEDGEVWLITGAPAEECSYEKYTNSYGDDCVQHGGYYRCWDEFVPVGIKGDVPLVIDIHGWGDNPSNQRSISGFESLAKTEGFIVVWPYGLCNSWNSGEQCCPPASSDEIDDVGFIRKLIEKVSGKYNIDSDRIYVTGLSNGCSMTQRLANEASDVVTAAACMALHLLVPEAPDYDPIPVMTLLGTNDDLYNESEDMPGAVKNFETWKEMNNCTGTYEVTWSSGNHVAWTYTDCDNDTEVTLVTIDGGGHVLYKGEGTEINTTQLAWDFLKRFSK